jgi:uncharacterized membrane protein
VGKGRLEAFSDGVMAIIITIMVLELNVPEGGDWADLRPIVPALLSYLLSFVFLGIYWNNHHHLVHAARSVNGRILWANLHLLFWLSLMPFVTEWMGETHFATDAVAAYGVVQLAAALGYFILAHSLISHHGQDSTLARALGSDFKGRISVGLWAAAIPLAFVSSWLACGIYVAVAIIWLVPDRRLEQALTERAP